MLYGTLTSGEWSSPYNADRINEFLEYFANGYYTIEIGFYDPQCQWDANFKEEICINTGEYYCLTIKDGIILNKEEIPNILSILNTIGITTLPAFDGDELEIYTLDDEGNWIEPEATEKENFFYVSYYSID